LVNQGVIPEGLGLNPPPEYDFVPIASSSSNNSENQIVSNGSPLDLNKNDDSKIEAGTNSGNVKNPKRKASEFKETPLNAPNAKKLRQVPKMRSKRVKV